MKATRLFGSYVFLSQFLSINQLIIYTGVICYRRAAMTLLQPPSCALLLFLVSAGFQISDIECAHFKCQVLNPLKMREGSTIFLPFNSTAPIQIPANFSCTYDFFVPKNAYLRLFVINSLLDKDYIEFADSVGYVRNLTVSMVANEELFATTGYGYVKIVTGPEGRSKALLVFQWLKMPISTWTQYLMKNENGKNVDCMAIQQNPLTFTAEIGEKIALNIAHSAYILDTFDSYFIFDGPNTDSKVVGRMSNHIVVPFIPSNQSVTVIGLTNQVVYSNVIANIQSNIARYRKYQAAVVIDQFGGQLDSINQTIAITFIAKNGYQLYMMNLKFNEIETENCEMRMISGTPSPASNYLLSYTPMSPLDISFPQQFPASQFTAELTDCSVYMVISKNEPVGFYSVYDERAGYIFTPSFLDHSQSPYLNFTMSSNESIHFSTTVESVTVYDDQILAINVLNSKGVSTMSTVITGNQTGGSADGSGTSMNINFSGTKGSGQAKIRYHISNVSGQLLQPLGIFLMFPVFI